jgi:hypothetical protein
MWTLTNLLILIFHPSLSLISAAWGNTVGNGTTFHVEVPGWRTPEQPVSTKTKDNSIAGYFGAQASLPFFTILITLDNGKVAAIEYDPDTSCNSDAACAANRNLCVGNMCGVDAATCRTSTEACGTSGLDPTQYCCPAGATCNDCDLKVSAASVVFCCVGRARASRPSPPSSLRSL